jgi:SAM-dependent methyltransferase
METISCIFCGEGESHALIEENGFTGRKCPRCGLIYISPRPAAEEIANLYGHDEAHLTAEAQTAAERYKRLHARNALRVLRRYAKCGKLLEIGPGAGFFMDEARAAGFSPYGIELNRLQSESIRNNLSLPCESRTLADAFPGERFDVIYHCDVISHFSDPIAEFKLMRERLSEKGVLIFETGNMGDVRAELVPQVLRFQYPDHLFFFSTRNVQTLLQQTGFRLLTMPRYSIGGELWLSKALSRMRKKKSSGAAASTGKASGVRPTSPFAAQLRFSLRYRLGVIAARPDHHQTMIVVAAAV